MIRTPPPPNYSGSLKGEAVKPKPTPEAEEVKSADGPKPDAEVRENPASSKQEQPSQASNSQKSSSKHAEEAETLREEDASDHYEESQSRGKKLFSGEEEAEERTFKDKLVEGLRWSMFTAKVVTFGLFGYTLYVYYYDDVTKDHRFVFAPILGTVKYVDGSIRDLYRLFTEPPIDKLLPDLPKMPPGYALPKTLVLDLKGTLISTTYSLGVGFEVMMRPGLMEFLQKVSQMYEVVIFSDDDFHFTYQTAENLDPNHRIFSSRLSRESMCLRGGELVKDLSYLNRDLRNVIIIEKDANRVKFHPDNVVILPEFTGNREDKALLELIPFLEHVAKDQRVKDVREELNKYGRSETGKKYMEHLRKIRDQITNQQSKGVSGLLMRQKR